VPTAARHRSRWSAASLRASSAVGCWSSRCERRSRPGGRRHRGPTRCASKDYLPRAPGDLVEVDTLDVRPSPGMVFKHFTARDPFPVAGARDVRAGGRLPRRRRYRYYVSRNLVRGSADRVQRRWRVAAPEIERAVVAIARRLFDDKTAVLGALRESGIESSDVSRIFEVTSDWSRRLGSETEAAAAIAELIERVGLSEEGIRVAVKVPISAGRAAGMSSPNALCRAHFFPMKIKRRGVEMRIILDGKDDVLRKIAPALLKAMARASRWFEELASGRVPSPTEIAKRESLQKGYVARLTRLAFFAPRIVDAVAGGPYKS
jgi:hypothetical protein